uniref:Uncharacterized protein n=1 Tax=Sipha flava TaxID=143950 RepID=A0A2S2QBD4_9HEMI
MLVGGGGVLETVVRSPVSPSAPKDDTDGRRSNNHTHFAIAHTRPGYTTEPCARDASFHGSLVAVQTGTIIRGHGIRRACAGRGREIAYSVQEGRRRDGRRDATTSLSRTIARARPDESRAKAITTSRAQSNLSRRAQRVRYYR